MKTSSIILAATTLVGNSAVLTERTKQLRHELSTAVTRLNTGKLIAARDTNNDVGVGQTVDKQMYRTDLRDSLTAGCKRLTEATQYGLSH